MFTSQLQSFSYRQNFTSLFLLHRYFRDKCSDWLYSPVPQVQTFTARRYHGTSTESNGPYFPRFSNVRRKICIYFSEVLPSCGTDFRVSVRLNPLILTSSRGQVSIVIFLLYPHNLHFLPRVTPFISYTATILTVIL